MAQSQPEPVLAGVIVAERGRRVATAAVGNLLASLGATVLRLETPAESAELAAMPVQDRTLRAGGKQRIRLGDAAWRRCEAVADVLLIDPPPPGAPDHDLLRPWLRKDVTDRIVCVVSPGGLDSPDAWQGAPEPLIQALGGAMAVTGLEGGPPEFTRVPIAELGAAIMAATAILAALRVRRRDGQGQVADVSVIEAASDQLRLHLPILDLPNNGYRQGCGHPVCCPWNAYRASDGWILICSTSQGHWEALLDAIGRPNLKADPRYGSAFDRRARIREVDGLVGDWAKSLTMQQVVAAIDAAGVPAGEILTIPQVVRNPVLRSRGTVADTHGEPLFTTALGLRRTPARGVMPVGAVTDAVPVLAPGAEAVGTALPAPALGRAMAGEARPSAGRHPAMPLAGVRVVELTRYTAGPLAGMLLASLGAEVIKIESPGGEEARRWQPQHGGASGYFINHNAGKRSVTLDLRQTAEQDRLRALVAGSDVLLQNLRPGVMDKIGLGGREATGRQPRLIHATISGFGLGGPELPALDTVIQGLGGLPSLVGDGSVPCRVGFSIADQISGHFAALTVLAAVLERDRSGQGQIVDISMSDAIAWLTQLSWPDGRSAIGPACRVQATDGWVAVAAEESAVRDAVAARPRTSPRTRDEWVADLAAAGIQAAPMLEPKEVYAQPVLRARNAIHTVMSGSDPAPVLTMPFGLTRTPALRPERMRALGEDNTALLETSTA